MRVGILGSGRVAVRHAQAWQAAGATITAVCGHHPGGAEKWMAQNGIEKAKGFSSCFDLDDGQQKEDISEFLSEVHVVSITTPPHDHFHQLQECIQAGKHVIVEKPLYCSIREVQEYVQRWKNTHRSQQRTGVCFVNRWFSAIRHAKQQVQRLGAIVSVQATYWNALTHEKPVSRRQPNTPRGEMSTLLSSGCHVVDLSQWFIESPITEVYCRTPCHDVSQPQRSSELLVAYECGAVGTVSVSDECFHPFAFRLMVQGEHGSIEITESYARIYTRDGPPHWEYLTGEVPYSGAINVLPYEAMIADFAKSIEEEHPTECEVSDRYVLQAHQVCLAAKESERLHYHVPI